MSPNQLLPQLITYVVAAMNLTPTASATFMSKPYIHRASPQNIYFILFSAAFTDWETENKYRIRNTLGQDVYFAAESM